MSDWWRGILDVSLSNVLLCLSLYCLIQTFLVKACFRIACLRVPATRMQLRLSFGLTIFSFQLETEAVSIKVGRLRLRWRQGKPCIHAARVVIHLKDTTSVSKAASSDSAAISSHALEVCIKDTVFSLVKTFMPRDLLFENLTIFDCNKSLELKVRRVLIDPALSKDDTEFRVRVNVVDVEERLSYQIIKGIQYYLRIRLSLNLDHQGHHLKVRYYEQSLNVNDLSLQAPRDQLSTRSERQPTEGFQRAFEKYSGLILHLTNLELRLERLRLHHHDGLDIYFSTLTFSSHRLEALNHDMLDLLSQEEKSPRNNEFSVAIVALGCSLQKEEIFKASAMNITITTDIVSHLVSDLSVTKCGCTFAVIDPSITIRSAQLSTLADIIAPSGSNATRNSDGASCTLRFLKSANFITKCIVSNFFLSYQMTNLRHLVLRANSIRSFLQNGLQSFPNSSYEKFCPKSFLVSKSHSDNFLKIDQFDLSHYRFDETSPLKLKKQPLIRFNKWEFFNQDLKASPQLLTTTLRELKFSFEDLDALTDLHASIKNWARFWHLIKSPPQPRGAQKTGAIEYLIKMRLKDAHFTFVAKHHLPPELCDVKEGGKNLTDRARGVGILVREALLRSDSDGKRAEVGNFTLYRLLENASEVMMWDELGSFRNILISDKGGISVTLPTSSLKFDVNAMWLFFYMKSIANRYFPKSDKDASSNRPRKESGLLHNFGLKLNSIVIDVELPQETKMLICLQDITFKPGEKEICLRKLKLLIESVYSKGKSTMVPLLTVGDLSFGRPQSLNDFDLIIKSSFICFKTEYHLRLYRVFDNIVTMVKALKQIRMAYMDLSQFKKLEPVSENPKKLPNIRVESELLLLNVEEDIFEQELGLIYKVGVLEQRDRLEKIALLNEHQPRFTEHDTYEIFENGELGGTGTQHQFDLQKEKLLKNISTSWINRFRKAKLLFQGKRASVSKSLQAGEKEYLVSEKIHCTVFKVKVENLALTLGPPSFPLESSSQFLFDFGKGIPQSTCYTFLCPMKVNLETKNWTFLLRDYPLPILSFPNTSIVGDLVFAEKMPSLISKRSIYVPFVPMSDSQAHCTDSIYGANIVRTINPLKTYMNLVCSVNSSVPTNITWGKSLQPGYQSVMAWFDYLTKPPLDPSEKLGFWDKFRLFIHGRLVFKWATDSEMHLNIKGSHDPYSITDEGAGLSFCWSGDTVLSIHESDNPCEFLKITSKNFKLGIRDFTDIRKIDKTIMDLTGAVVWKMGLIFEQGSLKRAGEEKRDSKFRPHYEVDLCNPLFVPDKKTHDSYRGFRSDFIHMSFGVYSNESSSTANQIFLAPHTMAHFLTWWGLFSAYTSGPIRQGSLFPDLVQNPKKFSRALFTVKYQLFLAPLTFSHVYGHADSNSDSTGKNNVAFTGLKGKVDSLKIDLHQKRVRLIHADKVLGNSRTVWKFRQNEGEVDCLNADVRCISAVFNQESVEGILAKNLGVREAKLFGGFSGGETSADSPASDDGVGTWYDFRDYCDLNQVFLESSTPLTFKSTPLLFSPRISYLRHRNDEGDDLDYPFGEERSHDCMLGHNGPEKTQEHLAHSRAVEIETKMESIKKNLERNDVPHSTKIRLKEELHDFGHRLHVIHRVLKDLEISKLPSSTLVLDDIESLPSGFEKCVQTTTGNSSELARTPTIQSFTSMKKVSSAFVKSSFDNKFIIHNPFLKINNRTRDLLMNYASNVFHTKRSSFFQTHKAVSLLDELLKSGKWDTPGPIEDSVFFTIEDFITSKELMERYNEIIREVPEDGLEAFDNYQIKLLSPQIQMTSILEQEKAVVVTARDIEVSIIDVNQVFNRSGQLVPLDVNTLVETRICTILNEARFLIFDKQEIVKKNGLGFHVNGYGLDSNSSFWPPWLPMEMCYNCETLGEFVFLERNDMVLTFTRPNSLFFSKSSQFQSNESRLKVGFPNVVFKSNSQQYSAVYAIATDLASFASKYDRKVDKLSRILLADEVKENLDKLEASIVIRLQQKIRELYRMRGYLKIYDPQSYKQAAQEIAVEAQMSVIELELLMTAIKKNYDDCKRFSSKGAVQDKVTWQIRADELVWRLYDAHKKEFLIFELGPSSFVRSQGLDGSNSNKLKISTLRCFNLQKDPVYRELLAPYTEFSKYDETKASIEILWAMGVPVGGIPNLEELVAILQPLKFKMDHKTSAKLVDYLFPDIPHSPQLSKNAKPSNIIPLTSDSDNRSPIPELVSRDMSRHSSVSSSLVSDGLAEILPSNFSSAILQGRLSSPGAAVLTSENDLNEMVTRSTQFFNVKTVVIQSVTLLISYRGSKSLITNVENLKVKVPTMKYSNKLWCRAEFLATLKRDIIKVVVQHMGNIIGNKFIPHKKEKRYNSLEPISSLARTESFRSQNPSNNDFVFPSESRTSNNQSVALDEIPTSEVEKFYPESN
ncbi:LAMI_0H05512g1_1 [Lachancea mirantina]|uniref:LAMI_0H05512g1_1 n=1 Tax=Lachancea mirantina TaxID=1230905 RepID=A0A1G4KEY5_9SACH|nr:LAMI_0H05512g1_1 [Lachancea mirantina]